MQRLFKTTLILLWCLAFTSVWAAENNSNNIPEDLMVRNKPIDPLCFNLEGNSNLIHLQNCGIKKQKYKIVQRDKDLIKKGYIGFDWKEGSGDDASQGSSYYKSFPAGNQQYWVYTINNTGGSGVFTALNLVKRKDDKTLEIKTIASGDRCNGGVQDVQLKNNQLQYSINLTPADLLTLTKDNPSHLQAYDDLAACAVCCTGKAFYGIDLNLNPQLLYVDLGSASDFDDLPTQGKYQQCFNDLYKQYINAGKNKLDASLLKQFGTDFNAKCVAKKNSN